MAPNYTGSERINERVQAASVASTRDGDVYVCLKALEEEIASLGAVSEDLINKIHVVMRDPIPTPAEDVCEKEGTCALSKVLADRCIALRKIRERLIDAYQRVEL